MCCAWWDVRCDLYVDVIRVIISFCLIVNRVVILVWVMLHVFYMWVFEIWVGRLVVCLLVVLVDGVVNFVLVKLLVKAFGVLFGMVRIAVGV